MNILVLIHNQVNTGPYLKVIEMCQALTFLENDVTLFATSSTRRIVIKKIKYGNLKIYEFPDMLWGKLRQGIDLWNIVVRIYYSLKLEFDIVHAIDCRPVVILPAILVKKIKKIPLIISWWDLFGSGGTSNSRSGKYYAYSFGKVETFFEEHFRKYADYSTCVSSYLFNKLIILGIAPTKINLMRVGCRVDLKYLSINKSVFRDRLSLPQEIKIFCFLGSLFKSDKELFVNSLEVLNNNLSQQIFIIVIGTNSITTKQYPNIIIKSLGILGNIEEMKNYLHASDFGLMPMKINIANKARWPSKATDYWAAGLPVISTSISDFDILFKSYMLGILSKNDKPEDFALVMQEAIEMNESKYKEIQKSIIDYVRNNLDWRVLSNGLNSIYMGLK